MLPAWLTKEALKRVALWLLAHWREVGCLLAVVFFLLWRQAAAGLNALRAQGTTTAAADAKQAGGAQANAGQDFALHVRPKPQPVQPKGCPPCQECPDLDLLLKSFCAGSSSLTQTASAKAETAPALLPSFKAWELGIGVGRLVTTETDQLQPYARGSYFRPWTPSLDAGIDLQVFGPWDLNRLGDEGRPKVPLGFAAGGALRF